MTNRYVCVTLHSYHFYVEEGLPKTQVLLWVYGNELRAVFDNVVLAEYHCRYDLQHRHVKDIRDGRFYATRFASPQGLLIPLNPQESLVLYRPRPLMCQARLPFPAQHRNDQSVWWCGFALFVDGFEVSCKFVGRLKWAAYPTGLDILLCLSKSLIGLGVLLHELLWREHQFASVPLDFNIVARGEPQLVIELLRDHYLPAGAYLSSTLSNYAA
jgi:hypothetical protein